MKKKLVAIGVGPGDPDLITVAAVKAVNNADHAVFMVNELGDSRAKRVAAHHCDLERKPITELRLPHLENRKSEGFWREIAGRLSELNARNVVFAVVGDPMLWSSFSRLARHLDADLWDVEVIPGVTAAGHVVAAAGTPIENGLTITTADRFLSQAPASADRTTTVIYKIGRRFPELKKAVGDRDAFIGCDLGLPSQVFLPLSRCREPSDEYFCCVLIPR